MSEYRELTMAECEKLIIERLRAVHAGDTEIAHSDADKLLLEFLDATCHPEVQAALAFRRLLGWVANKGEAVAEEDIEDAQRRVKEKRDG